jgi:hypothetical protein
MSPASASALGALSSHRFLMRAAFAATNAFAWVFALQFFYAHQHNLRVSFVSVITLYALAQVVSALLTPYAAVRIVAGVKRLMFFGVLFATIGFSMLAASLSGESYTSAGLIGFALFMGAYRALYWVPFSLERERESASLGIPQEFFLALMPAIAGLTLTDGSLGAITLLVGGIIILLGSLAPLSVMPEVFERYSWGYRETFGELFEAKYNPIVESAFLEGVQGTALLLLWPLSVFIISGSSYKALGLVLTCTLLLSVPLRAFGAKLVRTKPLLHATLAASAWVMRLAVATPAGVVLVDAFASTSRKPHAADMYSLEQAADNTTYLDELSALKEISLAIGRLAMCAFAAICITFFSMPAGISASFVLAALASIIAIVEARKRKDF